MSSSICHSLYGTLPTRSRRAVCSTSAAGSPSATSPASTRPGCSRSGCTSSCWSGRPRKQSRTATGGCRSAWTRSPRSVCRCAATPPTTRSSGGSAGCSRPTSSRRAQVRGGHRPHRRQTDRDLLGELPRGPLRPAVRDAHPRRRDRPQRVLRLRPRADHARAVRDPRPACRRLARGGQVGAGFDDGHRATSGAPRCGSARRSVRSTAGSRHPPTAWPAAVPCSVRRWGRRADRPTAPSGDSPRSWPRRGSSRCASTTTAPATPRASRTTLTGSRPGWPASRRRASTSSTSGSPTSPRSGCASGPRWPAARPPPRRRSTRWCSGTRA